MDAAELITELRSSGAEGLAAMASVPADALGSPGYENGWTVHGIMAHVASMEFTYRRLPDVARSAGRDAQATGSGGRFDMDGYNARQIEKRRDATPQQLMEEFAQGRGALIALAENLDPDLLATPIRSAGGITGTLAEVMATTAAGHVRQHTLDFMRAAGGHEPSERDISAAAVLLIAEEARALLAGVSEVVWRTPRDGDWSPANVAGHLAEMLPYWPAKAIAGVTQGTPLGRDLDDSERLAGPARFTELTPADAIAALADAAHRSAETICALPLDAWRRPLPHRERGTITPGEVIEQFTVRHGHEHLDQLARLLRAAG